MFEEIKNGNIEGVKLAIANGSDVNAKDERGEPADGRCGGLNGGPGGAPRRLGG